jgi:hypothetical protein
MSDESAPRLGKRLFDEDLDPFERRVALAGTDGYITFMDLLRWRDEGLSRSDIDRRLDELGVPA